MSNPPSSPADLEAAFETILKSDTFSKAYAIRSVLRYLWDHRNASIDEYSIAVHGLNRRPDFDPKTDSAVRVTMARLRSKLKEFYESEGRESPLLLWIPRHGFELEYQFKATGPLPPAPPAPTPIPAPRSHPLLVPLLAGLLALSSVTAAVSLFRLARATTPPIAAQPAVPPFWQRFLAGGNRVLMVLPDTTFLQWRDGQLSAGDSTIEAFSAWTASPTLQAFTSKLGDPTGWTNFVSIPDTLTSIRLVQYLQSFATSVRVVSSQDLQVDSFLDTNVLLVGLPNTSYQLRSKMAKLDFRIDPAGKAVLNHKPKAGEPAVFQAGAQTGRRIVSYGVLAVTPGRTAAMRTMLLAAANPVLVLPMVTSAGPLAELERNWAAAGSPPYFQAVVETISDSNAVLRIRIVAFRPLSS